MASRNVRARPLPWRICQDPILAKIKDPWAKLLFTWVYPSTDNLACLEGDPAFIRAQVFPREDISTDKVEKLLGELHEAGAILWYQVEGLRYVFLPQVINWQKLVGNMVAESSFPPPPEQELEAWCKRTGNRYIPKRGRSDDPRLSFIHRTNVVRTGYRLKSKSKSKVKVKDQDKVEGQGQVEGQPAQRGFLDKTLNTSINMDSKQTDGPDLDGDLIQEMIQKLKQAGVPNDQIVQYIKWCQVNQLADSAIEEAVEKTLEVIEDGHTIRNPFAYLRKATEEKSKAL